jgi:putative N-acetylmannosamine-6-phosphate epimerase
VGKDKRKRGVNTSMIKVAVSPTLSHLKEFLLDEGMKVVDLDDKAINREGEGITAIVVSGTDINFLGMQNISAAVPVINAHGLTDEEISAEIKKRGRLA